MKNAIVIIGAGGLGCPAALALAQAGAGPLVIADGDTVEASNLARQWLYTPADVGRGKAGVAATALARLVPGCAARAVAAHADAASLPGLLEGAAVVLDATDARDTKYMIARACLGVGVPVVHGSALGLGGHVFLQAGDLGPCLACAFGAPVAGGELSCGEAGVLGTVTAVVGAMMARLAVLVLRDPTRAPWGVLNRFDGVRLSWHEMRVGFDEGCPWHRPHHLAPEPRPLAPEAYPLTPSHDLERGENALKS